jgi:hypothetical protein
LRGSRRCTKKKLCEGINLGPHRAHVLNLNAPIYVTPKMDNFAKKCIFLGEKTKVGGGHLFFKIPNLLRTPRSLRLLKTLKLMVQKGSRIVFHHKGFEPEYGLRQGGLISWASIPTQKISQGYNSQQRWHQRRKTTNVGNKEGAFVLSRQIKFVPRAKCLKLVLW